VTRLRALHKPPLGNRPCVFYANFDLFWLGENLLVCREHLRSADWPVAQVAAMTATLARCTAERLAKWGFADTVAMLRGATETLTARPDVEAGALLAYLNALLLAAGRVQAWVDAAIPWGALDAAVTLHETPSTRIPA
jgi:hypothetical protein